MADELDWLWDEADERMRLERILQRYYKRMLRSVHRLVESAVGFSFDLDDAAVRRIVMLEGVERVVRIDETTKNALRQQIALGQERGYSKDQIARGVPEDGYRGIDGLFKETWKSRPETVARTELQHAMVRSSSDRYRASGVVDEMEIIDGEDWDEICAGRNGKRVPVSTTVELVHPNCTVVVAPIVRENLWP